MGVDKGDTRAIAHANSRITLDLYTHAVSIDKREANNKQLDMLMGSGICVPSSTVSSMAASRTFAKRFISKGMMVGTSGFEPETSTVSR